MAKHGGFAAALQIRQQTFQQFLKLLHIGNQLPRSLNTEVAIPNQTGPGQAILTLNLYVPAPIVDFDPLNGTDTARVLLRVVGPMQIEAQGVDNLTRNVAIDLIIETSVTGSITSVPGNSLVINSFITITGPAFNLNVSFIPLQVLNSAITVISGPDLPPAWQAFFSSATFRTGLALQLTNQLANITVPLPPSFTPAFQALQIGSGSTAAVTAVIGDGFVTLGVDLTNSFYIISPSGNPAEVENFLSQSDIALIVDEIAAPLLALHAKMEANAGAAGGALTSLSLAFENDHLKVMGHADVSAGSADFVFTAKPMLGRPDWVELVDDEYGQFTITHQSDEIWIDVNGVDVDTQLAWWMYLVLTVGTAIVGAISGGFLLGGEIFVALLMYGTFNSLLIGMKASAISAAEAPLLRRQQETTIAGIPVEIYVTALQVFPDRIQSRAKFTPDEKENGVLWGPTSINVRDLPKKQKYTLTPSPLVYDINDPEMRLRWQLRRRDTNEIVVTVDVVSGKEKTHSLELPFLEFGAGSQPINDFNLSVRVYRFISGQMVDFLNRSLDIHISDRLDRRHPYVRWHHKVGTPNIEILDNGDRINHGLQVFLRQSKLHRTDYRRCLFVEQFTNDIKAPDYLDQFPFDPNNLFAVRDKLCDYCFWGSPHNFVPLPLPDPKP